MKANELKIGDWVSYYKSDTELVIGRIKKLNVNKYLDGDDEIEVVDGKGCWTTIPNINKLQPIPLTPEILEKNGFTHSFGDSDFCDYEKWEKKVDDNTIRVIKDNDGWFCRVDDNKLTRSMGISPDVHTMQNIIHIGGIEKAIEL